MATKKKTAKKKTAKKSKRKTPQAKTGGARRKAAPTTKVTSLGDWLRRVFKKLELENRELEDMVNIAGTLRSTP